MASDNHKTTHQYNIQRVATPSVIIQIDTRGSGTQHQHPGRLQLKPGLGLGRPSGNSPGLWLRVPVTHRYFQPIPSTLV